VQHKRNAHRLSLKSKPIDDEEEEHETTDLNQSYQRVENPCSAFESSRPTSVGRIWTCTMFLQAASAGNLTAIRLCIASGIDVNIVADDRSSALHCAARAEQTAAVQYLLSTGADASAKNEKNLSPFHEAIRSKSLETVDAFCQSGAHLDSSTATINSLAQSESKEILLRCLTRLGESIPNDLMYDVLCIASRDGHPHIVKVLLSLFAEKTPDCAAWEIRSQRPNQSGTLEYTTANRYTPLHQAARKGHLKIVQLLLEHQTTINLKKKGETPLLLAARNGSLDVVMFMMKLPGIDIECLGQRGLSLLHFTAGHGWVDPSSLFLSHSGIYINARCDYAAQTPLHFAACSGRLQVVVLLLQQQNIDTRCQDHNNLTALQLAALHGHYLVAQVLLDHEEMPAVSNDTGIKTPARKLLAACEIMEKCLSHSDFLDINLRGKPWSRGTQGLLHSAVRKAECSVIQILLRHNDINVNLEAKGRTPLYLAAELGQTDAARLLLQHQDINVDCRSQIRYSHVTPLQVARRKGFSEIVELLLAKGAQADLNPDPPTVTGNVTVSDSTIHESHSEQLVEDELEVQSHLFLDEYMDDTFVDMGDVMETDEHTASWMDTGLQSNGEL
jgi:ankyrin repeat protein